MLFGTATADITPELGLELSGGAFGPAENVLHPLRAKVLIFQQGAQRICLISCDLLGFSRTLADAVRRQVSQETSVPFDAICLSATHTHCGPATVPLRHWGRVDSGYCQFLCRQIVQAAGRASQRMVSCTVGSAVVDCPDVGVNRCSHHDPADVCTQLAVLRVEESGGRPAALVVNYACHPVNLHSGKQISPDFPYYLQENLREYLGAQVPVLFLNGASGDVNPANFQKNQQSDANAQETAALLSASARQALSQCTMTESAELAFCCMDVDLPLASLPDVETLQAIANERSDRLAKLNPQPGSWQWSRDQNALDWANDAIQAVHDGRVESSRSISLQAIRIGDAAMVAIPAELFTRFGRQIIQAGPFAHQFPVTLANGLVGYIPDPEAFEAQTYEAVHVPRYLGLQMFQPDVGQRLTAGAKAVLAQLPHMSRNAASRKMWGQSCNLIVGGGQAHKRPVKYLYRGGPAFATRAQGARFYDADGNEYIDYLLGYGPIVIGHCDPQVNAAIQRQMDQSGTVFSVEHPLAIELARTLCGLIPSAEMVMYFLGGSSATLGAVRIARAHTGRQIIIRCGYHGWYDGFPPLAKGLTEKQRSDVLPVAYNDPSALGQLLEDHRGQVAGVIVESVQDDGPADGYFDQVRRLCDEHGAVFILDEVKTGFRFDLGGAQRLYNIQPDLSCFGKAMCNGYPGSVVVGRREVMEDRADTFLAATFHSDALSLVAARETIRILQQRDGIGHFRRLGSQLIEGCNEIFNQRSLPLRIGGHPAMPTPSENGQDDPNNPCPPAWSGKIFGAFFGAMQRGGIYVTGHPWFVSLAHGQGEIDQTLEVARAATDEALDELTGLYASR